ncbi:hypothetical protein QT397_10205 [Microbulbifer sp. MKSA007]|uniref:hypothetical protein n=1 Tax=Microbulbifer sp. EKSA005 TaxID=3243364 RepID=UPI002B2C1244|nr:hypothetical protein QT397_10205 [Microbulbifer sp. MKSA007]
MHEKIKELLNRFSEWEGSLTETQDEVWPYQLISPTGDTKLKFSYYDRLVVKFERVSIEFWTASEAFETLENIINEKLVTIEYLIDRDLAKSLKQDIPDKIPNYMGGSLCGISEIPETNSEWHFANTIKVTSWLGTYSLIKKSVYVE